MNHDCQMLSAIRRTDRNVPKRTVSQEIAGKDIIYIYIDGHSVLCFVLMIAGKWMMREDDMLL